MFACDALDLDFLNTAPKRLHAAVKVGRPPSEVFAAFAHDPANWGEFFPGFDHRRRAILNDPLGVSMPRARRHASRSADLWKKGLKPACARSAGAVSDRARRLGARQAKRRLLIRRSLCVRG